MHKRLIEEGFNRRYVLPPLLLSIALVVLGFSVTEARRNQTGTLAELLRERQDVIRLLGEVSSLRNKLAQMDEFLAGNERQAARAREEEAAVVAESAEVERRRGEIEQEIEALQTTADALASRRREIEEQLAALREEAQSRRKSADQIRTDLSRLTARCDSLEEILSHHAYTTETVKNLFAAIQREPVENFKPIGILADYIEVDPKHEKATEEFLREESDLCQRGGGGSAVIAVGTGVRLERLAEVIEQWLASAGGLVLCITDDGIQVFQGDASFVSFLSFSWLPRA